MDTQQEKQSVEVLISEYAEAINSGNRSLIPGFYSHDAIFMPDKMKAFSRNDLERDNKNLFTKFTYSIAFSVQEVTIHGDYAFVQAGAHTITTKLGGGEKSNRASQDFFVLHKEEYGWKIFRYIFNNVVTQ